MKTQHIIFILVLLFATACTVLIMHKPKAPVDLDVSHDVDVIVDTIQDTIH